MKFYHFLFVFIALFHFNVAKAEITIVRNQGQFDEAMTRINNGEEMNILLKSRIYILKDNIKSSAPLFINGNGSTILKYDDSYNLSNIVMETDRHYVYKTKSQLEAFALFFSIDGSIMKLSETVDDSLKVNFVEGDIISPNVFSSGTDLKIPISQNLTHLKNRTFAKAFGYFDCGWETINFCLNKSDESYFYCTTINSCATNNFQYDKDAYKKQIRFVLYNAELKPNCIYYDDTKVYVPKDQASVFVVNSLINRINKPSIIATSDIKLKNLHFIGLENVTINSKKGSTCEINDCIFKNSLGSGLTIIKENGEGVKVSQITRCVFLRCALFSSTSVVLRSSFNNNICIIMKDCIVSRYPDGSVGYKNAIPSVAVYGDVSLIGNRIYNSCRGQLGLNSGYIIAKNNFLYNTDAFNKECYRNYSNDWGLIYCNQSYRNSDEAINNKLHCILLEGNLLYGAYSYGGDARGVFIDDGRGDVKCWKNIVLKTQRYSIDARNASGRSAASIRNQYIGNIVDNHYRLAAGVDVKGDNVPVVKKNIMITEQNNEIKNVNVEKEDVVFQLAQDYYLQNDILFISKEMSKVLKRERLWRKVWQYIKIDSRLN